MDEWIEVAKEFGYEDVSAPSLFLVVKQMALEIKRLRAETSSQEDQTW